MCCFPCHTYPPTFNFDLLIPGLTFSGPQRRNTKRQEKMNGGGEKKGEKEERRKEGIEEREIWRHKQINRDRGAKGVVWRR